MEAFVLKGRSSREGELPRGHVQYKADDILMAEQRNEVCERHMLASIVSHAISIYVL
jgi:hypothetical protein